MSAVVAAALFAQLVVVGGDPAACKAAHAAAHRPAGAMTVHELLELMAKNDCVRYLVPAHLLGKRIELGLELQVRKDWRAAVDRALAELGISLHDETVVRVDGPAPPPGVSEADFDRGIKCATAGHCVIERKLLDRLLGDTNGLAATVRVVPWVQDGKVGGFKLYAIRPGSFWSRIGLLNGDSVASVNGLDISSPEKALEVYTQLRNATQVTARIVRRGQPLTLQLEIR